MQKCQLPWRICLCFWEEKNKEVESQQQEIAAKGMQVHGLISSMEELDTQHQEAMTQMIRTRNRLQETNQKLEEYNRNLQQEMKRMEEESQSATARDLCRLKEEMTALQEDQARQRRQFEELIQGNEQSNSALCKELCSTKEQCDKLMEERAELQSAQQSHNEEVNELKSENAKAVVSLNALHMDKNKMQVEITELQHKIQVAHEQLLTSNEVKVELEDKIRKMEDAFDKDVIEVKTENDDMQHRWKELECELTSSQGRCHMLQQELSDAFKASEDAREKHAAELICLSTQINSLQNQNQLLSKDVSQLEHKLQDQAKHYQSHVSDLENACDMNESGLQQDHEKLMKLCHEKDLMIENLQKQAEEVQGNLDEIKDKLYLTIQDQKNLGIDCMLEEKVAEINVVIKKKIKLEQDVETMSLTIEAHKEELARLVGIEKQYKVSCEECKQLNIDVENLRSHVSQLESKKKTQKMLNHIHWTSSQI